MMVIFFSIFLLVRTDLMGIWEKIMFYELLKELENKN